MCVAGIPAGTQQSTDERQAPYPWNPAPGIETVAVQHQRVAFGLAAVGCGKTDPVAALAQYLPAHGDFTGVRVPGGQRHQNVGHIALGRIGLTVIKGFLTRDR
jgi:hypothetical protein